MQNIVERRIMWGDLDSLGIVFYPRYYEWIDASGHLFFEAINLNLGDLWKERNIMFGLVETSCRYAKPGRYHQRIRIITDINELNRKTLFLKHEILSADDDSLLVDGLEKRICLDLTDPQNLQAITIPDDIYAILKHATENN